MTTEKKLNRREFIKLTGLAAGAAALAACQPQVVTETVKETVKETIVVQETVIVEGTSQVIEKVVTATAVPVEVIVTVQGRELPEDAAPLEKQVLHDITSEPKHLDTARDIYNATFATNHLNEPLLRNDQDYNLVPALAESWKPGEGVLFWEFVIREGAKWSDGEPITADDVVYTYQHLANPALANPWVWYYFDIKGVRTYATGEGTAADLGVEKVDDRTVRIYGEAGAIPFLPGLVSYQAAVLAPKHVAEADPEHWADDLSTFVSSGPYIGESWEHNKSAVLVANPMYNGPHKPGIQRVELDMLAGGTALNMFLNKEIDILGSLVVTDMQAVRADPKLNPYLHFFANFQSDYLAMDTMTPEYPTSNLNFRKALAHAIDRDTMCAAVLLGTAQPGYSMLPPGFPAYNPELKEAQKFDVAIATEYLNTAITELGVADAASIVVELYSNAREAKLEFVKQQWETNLGITVNFNVLEGGVWGQMRAEHAMMIYKGPYEYDYVDPNNMLTMLWRSTSDIGSPRHAWKSTKFDDLVNAAGTEADAAARLQMYMDAEKILADEECAAAFLSHNLIFQIWWPYLTGIPANKEGNVVYRYLDLTRFKMYMRNDVDEWRTA